MIRLSYYLDQFTSKPLICPMIGGGGWTIANLTVIDSWQCVGTLLLYLET